MDPEHEPSIDVSREEAPTQSSERESQTAQDFIASQLQLEADAREALPYVRTVVRANFLHGLQLCSSSIPALDRWALCARSSFLVSPAVLPPMTPPIRTHPPESATHAQYLVMANTNSSSFSVGAISFATVELSASYQLHLVRFAPTRRRV